MTLAPRTFVMLTLLIGSLAAGSWLAATRLAPSRDGGEGAAGGVEPPAEDRAAFQLEELRRRHAEVDGPWLEFLRVPELRTGLYKLPAGGVDPQRPHSEGEVYYVTAGRAVLAVDGEDFPARPGSVLYVAAGVDHRFHSIEEDLEVLVFFARER